MHWHPPSFFAVFGSASAELGAALCEICQICLQGLGQLSDMDAVHKGVVHLHGKGEKDLPFALIEFSPVSKVTQYWGCGLFRKA